MVERFDGCLDLGGSDGDDIRLSLSDAPILQQAASAAADVASCQSVERSKLGSQRQRPHRYEPIFGSGRIPATAISTLWMGRKWLVGICQSIIGCESQKSEFGEMCSEASATCSEISRSILRIRSHRFMSPEFCQS